MSRKRGRPQDTSRRVRIRLTLVLREGEDDDIIALYERTPPRHRARVTLATMRAGGVRAVAEGMNVDDGQVLQDIAGALVF
ncbi:MAG: hypothetical protein JW850_21770 [Thermoflexales bacterium]|nr:hypothetical protein [Thermoflexales bacterium]